jgi:GNAT superfamily N-acetyltransferase
MNAAKSIEVRRADRNDVEALARMAGELGYPSTAVQVRDRFAAVEGNPQYATFVAVAGNGQVVGWIQLAEVHSLESDPRAEITGLVVDSMHRGGGVGSVLVGRGQAWAAERGLAVVGVRSNIVRDRAHQFYLRLGYAVAKTQRVFRKTL